MAELVDFYDGGLTPSEFRGLTAGELDALIRRKDAVIEARKEAAKQRGN